MKTFLLLILTAHAFQPSATQDIVTEFSDEFSWMDNEIPQFNNLVICKNTGRVYIGAVNKLYQLSPDLNLTQSAVTGPKEDSPMCSVLPDCPSSVEKKLINNVNKAMVIDYAESRIIECGSLFQGICTVRNLRNISLVESRVREPVVANNATASTVAFIAPGPPNPPITQVVYVGVTFTGNGPYRSEVPAVSSRSLDSGTLFQIAETAVTTGTRMYVNSLARERYPINYIYGFSSEGFSYFLTTQMKQTNPSPFHSKLVRVCHDDRDYYSYTEIPIECISGNPSKDYNLVQAAFVGKPGSDLASDLGVTAQDDVLYAIFSESDSTEGDITSKPSKNSALCVYSLKSIRRKFMQNIQRCFTGMGARGLDFISPSLNCINTKLTQIGEDFCGLDVNTPLGGELPVVTEPVLTFDNHLTGVTATSTGDFTVAFLGTGDGYLKKVVIEGSTTGVEYANIPIRPNHAVNSDIEFDLKREHVYVMTDKKLSKVRVQDCSVYTTCGQCLGSKDPYCGWCSLENKCSLRGDCRDAALDPLYWISYKSGRCTTITSVQPHELQRTTARTLSLVIDNLPSLEGQFLCVFQAIGKTLVTNATRTPNGVSCTTPRNDLLPLIPANGNEHHFTSELSVRMADGPDFVATNFTFFDCNTFSSCTSCVASPFPCDWCVDGHRCTHDTAENCRNDILVTGIKRVGPSIRSGPNFCPRVNATVGGSSEILVPSGIKETIRVKVDNIAQFIVQTRFVCQFNIEGRVTSVNAQLLGELIYCDAMEFSYTSRSPNISATFAVVWGGSKPLDNPDNIHVLIFRCKEMADNCGMCLSLNEKFGCGWCQSSGKCEVKNKCGNDASSWLNRDQTCPNPQITSFEPMLGPWEGGTNITIRGINLGKEFLDIYGGITVAGIQCDPYESLYKKTEQIVCKVDGPGTKEPRRGPVIVKVADFRGESRDNYEFVDPQIRAIRPRRGPQSGGTRIKILGEHMNAGSYKEAYIGDSPCEIVETRPDKAICITGPASVLTKAEVRMVFDKGTRVLDSKKYEYVEDPKVDYADSGNTGVRKIPKGIPSGGINITVVGVNFNYIQDPEMYIVFQDKRYSGPCIVFDNKKMHCLSPKIDAPVAWKNIDNPDPIRLDFGFHMDNVKRVQNLSKVLNSHVLIYPDPEFESFKEEDGIKYYKSDYLTLNGKNLNRASKETDMLVRIGSKFCNVTSLSLNQLTCKPPGDQPPALINGREDYDELPEVVVMIGNNLEYKIGQISYSASGDGQLPKPVMIGVAVGAGILLLIVLCVLILYRRKSTESTRNLKNMQDQMDVLELRVAAECKEAFTELQTEITELGVELQAGGIPFVDYRTYCVKILFPSTLDHPVLQWDRPELVRKEKGLRMFGQLIMNKTFLVLFIRTLESNRYFSMRDRVNVASLIMVTLQSRMEYCTDILKTLLADLIERCMEGRSHPKLLLRRTESVAEKMLSSWFTFLLYKFLHECAGEPLYMLYCAMKHQIDKGPVDLISHEARYSLSEEKLIRQQIEFHALTVFVSMSPQTIYMSGLDPQGDNMDIPVRALDCDAISQIKEKALDTIYRAFPFSQRPKKDDLDLEWRTGTSGRLILYDEDSTTKTEGDWKRVNTLNHYRVPDGALLTLVPKQSSMYNISTMSDKSDRHLYHKYETLNLAKMGTVGVSGGGINHSQPSPTHSRTTSPLKGDYDNGLKVWHLVRHEWDNDKDGERHNKMVSEIYLTRLLATKGTLQKFVDDLFETIFSTAHRGSALPLAIKYMFDFLDDQALQHGITDEEVVHTWKSNSLPLRFWVNLIKNPEFVFDIGKSNIVDACLSVTAQTFMDACSTSEHILGKDSPSSKLLYAKDIPVYKDWVDRYYADIKAMPVISDQDMNAMLAEESRLHANEFNLNSALHELYSYAVKYNEQLILTLDEDEFSCKQRLAYKLEQVHNVMQGDV
jgi:plexin A